MKTIEEALTEAIVDPCAIMTKEPMRFEVRFPAMINGEEDIVSGAFTVEQDEIWLSVYNEEATIGKYAPFRCVAVSSIRKEKEALVKAVTQNIEHQVYERHKRLIETMRMQIESLQDSLRTTTNTLESLESQLRKVNELDRKIKQNEELLREIEVGKTRLAEERAELHQLRIQTAYGFVYLIHNATQSTYKIGKSKDPVKRLSQLRTSSPDEIAIVCTIETSDMDRLEGELHQHFADKHIRGEWFRLTPSDVEYIKDRA